MVIVQRKRPQLSQSSGKKKALRPKSLSIDFMNFTEKERVFTAICQHSCSVMDGWVPYPSTAIQRGISLSLKDVRRYLKELKQEGLIMSDLYVEMGEDRPILIRGYVLTEAGKNTVFYKDAWEAERKICKACFDFDIGPVNADALLPED